MNTKIIEGYIQFAIDNGLEVKIYGYTITNIKLIVDDKINLLLITSKEFIEAIARGYDRKLLRPAIAYTKEQRDKQIKDLIDKITTEQAIAIRENELENFITNLGINEK